MNKITWKDIVFAQIDGFHVIPLAIFIALLITDIAFGLDNLVQQLAK